MHDNELSQYIKDLATRFGFDRCGIARAEPIGRRGYFRTWLRSNRAGSMEYLHRHFTQKVDPRELLEGARSIIVVAMLYRQEEPARVEPDDQPRGRVAMYAWGNDYHTVLKRKLHAMVDRMRKELPEPFEAKTCVDTAPLLEREIAAAAGIGWIGKNTLVLNRELGSYFFLGAIVTTLELRADEPMAERCGSCTACLDACPTNAFLAAYEMDATRCISYLTIEHRGHIPQALRPKMGDWIFGCDVCQQVCPYNRDTPATVQKSFSARPPAPTPQLAEILDWSVDDYRRELRGSAIKRATLDMLKRNARIALDNARREHQPKRCGTKTKVASARRRLQIGRPFA